MLVVIGRSADARIAGDGVEGFACGCARKQIAGLYHVWQVIPGVGSGIPGDHAVADGKVDVASGEYPPAVVGSRGSRGAAPRQIGDCSVVPSVRAWIVAIGFVRRGNFVTG